MKNKRTNFRFFGIGKKKGSTEGTFLKNARCFIEETFLALLNQKKENNEKQNILYMLVRKRRVIL